jgi:DNA-binding transcriptional regulator YhcF (GntR family)
VTQIKLGIASRDLSPSEKLPSTRELARRFSIHQNTVSAAYRELAAEGLVVFRKGSGVYVCDSDTESLAEPSLDHLLGQFVSRAALAGHTRNDVESAMRRWIHELRAHEVLVVESDFGLRSILVEEIRSALGGVVSGIGPNDFEASTLRDDVQIAALFDEKEKLQAILPPNIHCVYINVNSVPLTMAGSERPSQYDLVAVVSDWPQFSAFAKLYLIAASIDPEALIIRSTSDDSWREGLEAASIIICDSSTATEFPGDKRVRTFRLVADSSLADLKSTLI